MSEGKADVTPIDPAVWRTVWTVLVGGMAVLFDTTIVAVALHTLSSELHASVATIQWVSTGYLLALGVTIPITGWAQRMLGSKRLWLIALTLFLVGSVLSSLAWSAGSLIAFRVVQGVAGGMLVPLMSTMVMQAAGGSNLGKIMSVISLPAVLGPILGPVLGGLPAESALVVDVLGQCAVLHRGPRARGHLPAERRPAEPLAARRHRVRADGIRAGRGALGTLEREQTGRLRPRRCLRAADGRARAARGLRRLDAARTHRQAARTHPRAIRPAVAEALAARVIVAVALPLWLHPLRCDAADAPLLPAGARHNRARGRPAAYPAGPGHACVQIAVRPTVRHYGCTLARRGWVPHRAHRNSAVRLGRPAHERMAANGRTSRAGHRPRRGDRAVDGTRLPGPERDDVPDASIITRIAQQVGGSFGTAVLAVILTGATVVATSATALTGAFQQSFWWASGFTVVGVLVSLALPGRPPALLDVRPDAPTDAAPTDAAPTDAAPAASAQAR